MTSSTPRIRDESDRVDTDASTRILELLRSDGGRITTVRRAVVTALVGSDDRHVTADDLTAVVQRDHPDVHRSTIYRTLESLESLGVVEHVHVGHGGAVFHLTEHRHQHLVCASCGAVVDVEGDLLAELAARVRDEHGFEIDAHHFAVLGRCRACRAGAA